ncbi:magnesium transporter CorA family protein [archaeon]|nr:MAG: magnesium transporter CorA family protein [archaeon]
MLTIYKTEEGKLQRINEFEKGCWIHLLSPTEEEVAQTCQAYDIPVEFIKDPLDINERPRTESEGIVTLIVLRTPHYSEEEESVPFSTLPLGIIICESTIITVTVKQNDIVDKIVAGRIKNINTAKKSRFVLQIFYHTALTYLDYLKRINVRLAAIQSELHKSMKNEELIKLLNLEKSLVFFTTALRANELMVERLQRSVFRHVYPEDEDILEDVIIENRQAIEMANIYTNILSGTMDAYASVISNNLNIVMKFLTSVTIILTLPMIVASLYGMNVALPFQNSENAFLYVLFISGVLSLIGVFILQMKRWF